MSDDLRERVHIHDKVIFGDPENPDMRGLIADRDYMSYELKRTNEILMELRDSVRWLGRVVIGASVTTILGIGAFIIEILIRNPHV